MKTVYEASNSIEAHMILNLLEQAGIFGRIDGEFLQGGMGELPASGIMRVQVEEQDYSSAEKIISEWEAEDSVQTEANPPSRNATILAAIAGFIVGVVLMILFYQTPITDRGTDYTGNGTYEEIWHYSASGRPSKVEVDRNRDAVMDLIYKYDRSGLPKTASADNDFDGVFDELTEFHNGNPITTKVDGDGDKFFEYVIEYKYGVSDVATWIDPMSLKVRKKQVYDGNNLVSAELDSNGDGVLDTVIEYDSIEEIAKKSNKSLNTDASDAGTD